MELDLELSAKVVRDLQPAAHRAPEFFAPADYIETTSGNRVSRRSVLCGSQNIVLNGKTDIRDGAMLRGDLANIKVGRGCVLGPGCVLRPPSKLFAQDDGVSLAFLTQVRF